MRLAAALILLLSLHFGAMAQPYTSEPDGSFTVAEKRGCAPFELVITDIAACSGNTSCDMDFGNGVFTVISADDPSTLRYTYTEPGIYNLRLQKGSTPYFETLQVEVFENTLPEIQVSTCGGNQISVHVVDNNYPQYFIDFNDGSTRTVLPGAKVPYTYGTTGDHVIEVRGQKTDAADNCLTRSENVTVVASLTAPTINLVEVIDDSRIRFEMATSPDIQYRLEIAANNSTTFQLIKTIFNKTVDTVSNLRTDDNYYCFRLGAYDPCINRSYYSSTICTANFDLAVLNNENRLSWTTSTDGTPTLWLHKTPTGGNRLSTPDPSNPYPDGAVDCGTEYCYQLEMAYSNGARSISLSKCGTAISDDTPGAASSIATIVGETGVELQWVQPNGFTPAEFSIFKSISGDYGLLSKTTDYQLSDPDYTIESGSCYKISYVDVCGNESPNSVEACPIALTGSLGNDNVINLSWQEYTGYRDGVDHYTVEKFTAAGTMLSSVDVTSPGYTDTEANLNVQLYVYKVKAIANVAGVPISVSNEISIVKDPNLFYPKAFTPNGDALNDLFNVYGQYINKFEMDIFNRWGELMFTTTELDIGWDGNFKGTPMPEGTYTFVATITDLAGRTFKKSGSVLLMRKQ